MYWQTVIRWSNCLQEAVIYSSKNNWFCTPKDWSTLQVHRAEILFRLYPDLQWAYQLSRQLSDVFTHSKERIIVIKNLTLWYNDIEKAAFKSFNTITKTIENNYKKILNFFDNKSINAFAGPFNAKIKAFRNQFRGGRNVNFFLFRLSKIYA